jgi:hypothetical protein
MQSATWRHITKELGLATCNDQKFITGKELFSLKILQEALLLLAMVLLLFTLQSIFSNKESNEAFRKTLLKIFWQALQQK